MAVFDPNNNKLAIRIVYDGPGFAGKTTNIERICEMIPVARRTEMYTPGSLKGRTMFFDWLELDGPKVGGVDVRVQLLSVPGQAQRSYRRRPLLLSADTVVFVADSSPAGLDESKRSFRLLTRYLRERGEHVPLLVQANKQDVEGALSPEEVVATLRRAGGLDALGASAAIGAGVKETLQAAMKLAIKDVRERVQRIGLEAIAGEPETADALFDALLEAEERYLMGELEVPEPLIEEPVHYEVAEVATDEATAYADEHATAHADETATAYADETATAYADESATAYADETATAYADESATAYADESATAELAEEEAEA